MVDNQLLPQRKVLESETSMSARQNEQDPGNLDDADDYGPAYPAQARVAGAAFGAVRSWRTTTSIGLVFVTRGGYRRMAAAEAVVTLMFRSKTSTGRRGPWCYLQPRSTVSQSLATVTADPRRNRIL